MTPEDRLRKLSLARLRRAKKAEQEGAVARMKETIMKQRVEAAEAELRVEKHMVSVLKMQLNDANELTGKAQRRARYLQEQLNNEINRGRQLDAEIARLHAEIVAGTKSQPNAEPTTDSISQVVGSQHS